MTASTLPILPTTVVGSYAIPAWLWAAYEKIEAHTLKYQIPIPKEGATKVAYRVRIRF